MKYVQVIALMILIQCTSCSGQHTTENSQPDNKPETNGSFIDSRDGQTYTTFSFDDALTGTSVVWMAQNLDYKMQGSYAYDDNESFRKDLGLLYTWEAAKKACPFGWHLPSDSEWSTLVNEFGGMNKAGDALKSTSSWNENGNGTNSSGFNGFPAGHRNINDDYFGRGIFGLWWSSSAAGQGKAWEWNLHYVRANRSKVFRFDVDIPVALSVRCVRD